MSEIEVVVGRVGKPHGLRGEVTVDVRTDEPERRYAGRGPAPGGAAPRLREHRCGRSPWPASAGTAGCCWPASRSCADRTAAEAARGIVLHATIDADARPEDPDEFYDHQLVGLTALDLEGTVLGEVAALVHGGAQDLLTVRTPDGREALVPFVKALVPEVDPAAGRVVIADRPGLVTPLDDDA